MSYNRARENVIVALGFALRGDATQAGITLANARKLPGFKAVVAELTNAAQNDLKALASTALQVEVADFDEVLKKQLEVEDDSAPEEADAGGDVTPQDAVPVAEKEIPEADKEENPTPDIADHANDEALRASTDEDETEEEEVETEDDEASCKAGLEVQKESLSRIEASNKNLAVIAKLRAGSGSVGG